MHFSISIEDQTISLFIVIYKLSNEDFIILSIIQTSFAVSLAFFHWANIKVTSRLIINTAVDTVELVSFPWSLLESTRKLNQFSNTFFSELVMLSIVYVTIRIQNHS